MSLCDCVCVYVFCQDAESKLYLFLWITVKVGGESMEAERYTTRYKTVKLNSYPLHLLDKPKAFTKIT